MKIIVTGSDQSTLTTLRPDREEVRSTFIDTAEQYGGRDQYMSPGETLLGTVGACMSLPVRGFLKQEGIPFEEVTITVTADFGEGLTRIHTDTQVTGSLSPEERARVQEVLSGCALCKLLQGRILLDHHPVR